MADLEAVDTRLSFDDILEAVQDSRRGRWFLQEYETRIQKRDSTSILQAIARLENRMETLGPQSSTPDEMAKVRSAIANARSDLLKLGLGKDALSKEGRLFADLAEMARKAMPIAVDSNAGIVRTLQLVDEIDSAISPIATEDRGSKFFSADASLFERPAPVPKPVLIAPVAATPEPIAEAPAAAAPVKKEEAPATGAKLVIRKASQPVEGIATHIPVEENAEPAAVAEPTFKPEMTATAPEMPAIDNPRIVIIRRKPEDMPEVEVGEPEAAVSAA